MQPPVERAELKRWLAHVHWIGGAPCAGKSSIVTLLAERYEVEVYRCNEHFTAHTQRVEPRRQPTLHRLSTMSWNEIWMQPVAAQVENQFRLYREEWNLIVEDLLALPRVPCRVPCRVPSGHGTRHGTRWKPLLVEGTALLPECVSTLLGQPDRAIWIVPTAGFQHTHYLQRGAWVQAILNQCVDPDEAWRRWMERDLRFATTIAQDAAKRGLPVLVTDGSRSLEASAALVAAQLHIDTHTPSRVARRRS